MAAGVRATDLSFGVNVGWMHRGGRHPVEAAREAEAAGFDVVTAADHVGRTSPFVALAAAAAVTERVRLRTYVLDHGFWNPGLLARDVATLDAVSGGRVEIGLGVGYVAAEHTRVGLPFPPYAERLANLEAFAAELRRHLADPDVDPRPLQDRVPVLVAAMSPRGLQAAARSADVVALSGSVMVPGRPGALAMAPATVTDERVALVRAERERAGLPPAAFDVLLQQVVVDRDPEEVAADWVAGDDGLTTVEQMLDSPFVLWARTPEDAAEELLRRSARWGIHSWCTHPMSGAALGRVLKVLRS